jgi:hemerythrin-like domain-containing protein
MAPVYADHPFTCIPTPVFANKQKGITSDMFDEIASEMAIVHNIMVVGLNAIYLQAPHVKPADEKGFLNLVRNWYELLHHHHSDEEASFFPIVEAMTGETGIMEVNVGQHHAFHEPLEAFHARFEAFAAGQEKYDGKKLVKLIDAFGPLLVQHLAEEIPTLLGLRKYGAEKMAGLHEKFQEQGERIMVRYDVRQDAIRVRS